ncbi:Unknown protein sequence [Pseudomonas savastanoi pv. phaseolicola]|nr:Unknown protein sequence [Pseudomonas savastanoi pv. phaseolicola]KPB46223.1 Unknown protein sequence [Pseudomonas savastanoi pv. phaseolicola]
MEKIFLQLCAAYERALPPLLHLCVTSFFAVGQPDGQGGEA